MDNELFELCKDVYGRTGWSDTKDMICHYIGQGNTAIEVAPWVRPMGTVTRDDDLPLYTSDYLLEKLGDLDEETNLYRCHHQDGSRNWSASYGVDEDDLFTYEDTPLKALLKLTIALDDAGELK